MSEQGFAASDGRSNMLRAFKASGCVKCGRRYPELDWSELHAHHLDASKKLYTPNILARKSVPVILVELLKCQVLCVDCHRLIHSIDMPMSEGQMELFAGNGSWHYG